MATFCLGIRKGSSMIFSMISDRGWDMDPRDELTNRKTLIKI